MIRIFLPFAALTVLAACTPAGDDSAARRDRAQAGEAAGAEIEASAAPIAPAIATGPAGPRPVAAELTLVEWRKAENRASCAPLTITGSAAVAPVNARAATFSGGWAVAFDQPGLRSAYGVAGTGLLGGDEAAAATHEERLRAQWPHFLPLPNLPPPSFAGYGLEGARPYPADNPDRRGLHSLAYVRVAGQRCTYNVWSRLGRAHLEAMLDSLRLLEP